MAKKLTIDRVRQAFNEIEWILTSTEIKNSKQYMTGFCNNGHPVSIRWNNFQQGVRCRICAGWVTPTIEEIREFVSNENMTLLSTEFVGQHEKLQIKCPDPSHPVLHTSWSDFKHEGTRCKYCTKRDDVANRSLEEQRSVEIAKKMRIDLCRHLAKPYPFSSDTYCGKLAIGIIKRIGVRPDGMTIDHVISPAWFDHNDQKQIDLCWSAMNFQWLIAPENSRKSLLLTRTQMTGLNSYQICIANLAKWRSIDHEKMMRDLGLWMSKEDALIALQNIENDRLSA